MSKKKITIIKPKKKIQNNLVEVKNKRKVAAYARVSTNADEQLNSYETQIDYYTQHIKENPTWEFVKVYTDEGISGLSTKRREGFQEMINDALKGEIDLIITKSVSRFARNTVDTLTHVRKLKDKGVEVYFEKENIYTMDSKGELLITIMSSLAQEESRSISENVTWGQRKRFADGKVSMPYQNFLGYKKGRDERPEIVPEEAAIVKRIFQEFLLGMSFSGIARGLTEDNIKTPAGKDLWRGSTVKSILQNEKYKGDALLQKRFTVDFLTKKQKLNEGEVPQYYVENSHEGIVSDEIFDAAQYEFERRKKLNSHGSSRNFFTGRIICESCKETFTRKVWHSTTKYRRYIWQCGKKYAGDKPCTTPHFSEDEIISAFELLVIKLLRSRNDIISLCNRTLEEVLDTSKDIQKAKKLEMKLDRDYQELNEKLKYIGRQTDCSVEMQKEYDLAVNAYENNSRKLADLELLIEEKEKKSLNINHFAKKINEISIPCFSEEIWCSLVDFVIVPNADEKKLIFYLRSGEKEKVVLE